MPNIGYSLFKVATNWPELINKKIQAIESTLKEIQILNQAGFLVAKGMINREIRYLEFDGRARKTEDRIQFEVTIADSQSGPLPSFKAELKQEYYIFQPRQIGENQAILEQGFKLVIQQSEEVPFQPSAALSVLAETIADTGQGDAIVKLPVDFPEAIAMPKNFSGKILLHNHSFSRVVEGKLFGTILYRSIDNHLLEIEYNQSFSLLINLPTPRTDQRLQLSCQIADVVWQPTAQSNQWMMESKVIYQWYMLDNHEMLCFSSNQGNYVRVRIPVLQNEEDWSITKEFSFKGGSWNPTDVNIETVFSQSKITNSSLLVSAHLKFHCYGISNQGLEEYWDQETDFDELLPFKNNKKAFKEPMLVEKMTPRISRFVFQNSVLIITVEINLHCKIYEMDITGLMTDPITERLMNVAVWLENLETSFFGEDDLKLRVIPKKIERVHAVIEDMQSESRNGWLVVSGKLGITVSYIDKKARFREDVFTVLFQKEFLWKKLTSSGTVVLKARLEHDFYNLEEYNLQYHFLIQIEADLFMEEFQKIKTIDKMVRVNTTYQRKDSEASLLLTQPQVYHLQMEGEILLKLGAPKEIVESRAYIHNFNYRPALNALLIEGTLGGEIDYWDEDGYLRREAIDYPFWKFVQPQGRMDLLMDQVNVEPIIQGFNFLPNRSWPWQRGSVRILVELALKPLLTGGKHTQ